MSEIVSPENGPAPTTNLVNFSNHHNAYSIIVTPPQGTSGGGGGGVGSTDTRSHGHA